MNRPGPVPREPNLKANSPSAASKTWTRSLSRSATAIKSPDGEYATDAGLLNCLSSTPGEPNLKANVALSAATSKTWTRSFPWSTTAMRPPSGDQAIDTGARNVPLAAALPSEPNAKANVPFGWYTWTRWLFVSATANAPDRLMPAGGGAGLGGGSEESGGVAPVTPDAPPGPDARAGTAQSGSGSFSGVCDGNCTYAACPAPAASNAPASSPSEPKTCTRSLPVSATMSRSPAVA